MGTVIGKIKEYWTRSMLHRAMLVAPPVALMLWIGTISIGTRSSAQFFTAKVKKGDIIAQIDPVPFQNALSQAEADYQNSQANVKSLEAQIETARANVLNMKANIAKAQAALGDAETQLRRTKELADQGIVAVQQKDTAQATYDGALASLHS